MLDESTSRRHRHPVAQQKGGTSAAPLVKAAFEALKDPERRDQIGQQARNAKDSAREWKRARDERRGNAANAGRPPKATLNKHARRVRRLREGIEEAVEHDPALADRAAPFLRRLEQFGSRIAAASALQRDLRKQNFEQIDHELHDFENMVMQARFDSPPST